MSSIKYCPQNWAENKNIINAKQTIYKKVATGHATDSAECTNKQTDNSTPRKKGVNNRTT